MGSGFYLTVVREPRDDENYVMKAYERHLSRCTHCDISSSSRRDEYVLCDRGYRYARDVANYIFPRNGKYFSVVASEKGSRVQVKIPREAQGVRSLLAAIEDDLILHSQKTATGIQYNHIHQLQQITDRLGSRSQSPKLKTYKIIERKPQLAETEAFPCCILRRHTGHPPLYNTGCVGQPQSRHKSCHRNRIVERYPRACARGTLA